MAKQYDSLLRILLVGDTGVGKTCLICQYACNEFHENHVTTIGVDFKMKTMEMDGKIVKMQIWDTAGQERFEAITKQFYTRAQGCVLVYDICSRASFESLAKWLLYVKQYSGKHTAVIMIGNKCDEAEKRQVPTATAEQFAHENGLLFYESSAKAYINLEKPFEGLCRVIFQKDRTRSDSGESSVAVDLYQNNGAFSSQSGNTTNTTEEKKGWNCC